MSVVPAAQLDAVTVDAYGTLVVLEDPSDRLLAALRARGVDLPRTEVSAAFRAEAAFYRPRSMLGRDAESLAALRRDCVGVFLGTLAVDLDPAEFVHDFMTAIVFRLAEGAVDALEALRSAGLALACVANWDTSLREQLERVGVDHLFEVVVSSAGAGVRSPTPGSSSARSASSGWRQPARSMSGTRRWIGSAQPRQGWLSHHRRSLRCPNASAYELFDDSRAGRLSPPAARPAPGRAWQACRSSRPSLSPTPTASRRSRRSSSGRPR